MLVLGVVFSSDKIRNFKQQFDDVFLRSIKTSVALSSNFLNLKTILSCGLFVRYVDLKTADLAKFGQLRRNKFLAINAKAEN